MLNTGKKNKNSREKLTVESIKSILSNFNIYFKIFNFYEFLIIYLIIVRAPDELIKSTKSKIGDLIDSIAYSIIKTLIKYINQNQNQNIYFSNILLNDSSLSRFLLNQQHYKLY